MGRDYYIICDLIITYNPNDNGISEFDVLEYERKRMYLLCMVDKDNHTREDDLREMEEILESYKMQNKTLYNDGKWMILNSAAISEYIDFINHNEIPFDQIKEIRKEYSYSER